MSPQLSNALAIFWFVITAFGWIPSVAALRAYERRGEATLVLFLGSIYTPLMGLFAFAVVSGSGGRGMAQFRLELTALTLCTALAGLAIGAVFAWRRRTKVTDRRRLAGAVLAITLAAASLNLIALFVVGPVVFGVLALFAR